MEQRKGWTITSTQCFVHSNALCASDVEYSCETSCYKSKFSISLLEGLFLCTKHYKEKKGFGITIVDLFIPRLINPTLILYITVTILTIAQLTDNTKFLLLNIT